MRKWWICSLLSASLYAAPVGNPASAALFQGGLLNNTNPWVRVTTGYLADYVAEMQLAPNDSALFSQQRLALYSKMAIVSFSLLQRLEVYTLLGGAREVFQWGPQTEDAGFQGIFQTIPSYHFAWGAGARCILLQWGQTFLSAEGSLFAIPSNHYPFFQTLNRLNLNLDQNAKYLSLQQWQAGVGLSSRLWICTPYAGVQYVSTALDLKVLDWNIDYHNPRRIGYYWGLSASLTDKLFLTFERRTRVEHAYMFSTQAVF